MSHLVKPRSLGHGERLPRHFHLLSVQRYQHRAGLSALNSRCGRGLSPAGPLFPFPLPTRTARGDAGPEGGRGQKAFRVVSWGHRSQAGAVRLPESPGCRDACPMRRRGGCRRFQESLSLLRSGRGTPRTGGWGAWTPGLSLV